MLITAQGYPGLLDLAFRSPCLAAKDSPYGEHDFSVNRAIEALNGLDSDKMAKVNIGIPSYGRGAVDNISSTNEGLYQTMGDDSQMIPGDLDATTCQMSMSSDNPCGGMYTYAYILSNMISPNGSFQTKDWTYTDPENDKTYYIGSTLYADKWAPSTSKVTFSGGSPIALNPAYPIRDKTYNGVFLSYLSARDAKSYGEYAKDKGLGGAIMWTIDSDVSYSDKTNSLVYNFEQGYEGVTPPPVTEATITWGSKGAPFSADLSSGKFSADATLTNAPEGDIISYSCADSTTETALCDITSQGSFKLTDAKDQDKILVTAADRQGKATSVTSDPITVEASQPSQKIDVYINNDGSEDGAPGYFFYNYTTQSYQAAGWGQASLGMMDLHETPVKLLAWNEIRTPSEAITCPVSINNADKITYRVKGDVNSISCSID